MKKTEVTVPWDHGLHVRPAARLVKLSQAYQSAISIRHRDRIADAKSIISVLLLCATLGASLSFEINGEDEATATAAIEQLFAGNRDLDDLPRTLNQTE